MLVFMNCNDCHASPRNPEEMFCDANTKRQAIDSTGEECDSYDRDPREPWREEMNAKWREEVHTLADNQT